MQKRVRDGQNHKKGGRERRAKREEGSKATEHKTTAQRREIYTQWEKEEADEGGRDEKRGQKCVG